MPQRYNMHDAKTHLSELAERAGNGEEIVIARNGRPVARLVPLGNTHKPRRFGLWRDQVWMGEDFDDPLPSEIERSFKGEVD